jgi:hypothetical protein
MTYKKNSVTEFMRWPQIKLKNVIGKIRFLVKKGYIAILIYYTFNSS